MCVADLVVNILPLPIVAQLKVPIRQRASIGILLSLGAIATIAGVSREVWIYKALVESMNISEGILPLFISADVEIYVSLVRVTTSSTF